MSSTVDYVRNRLAKSRVHRFRDMCLARKDVEELIAEIDRLRRALKPFADCVVHLHPAHDPEAETLDGIKVREWRAAYAAYSPRRGSDGK